MSLAMKRLKNLGWLALVFLVAILLYPLSINVASVHSDLVRVDNNIRDAKREISFLQAELRTRASLQQLEEWNDLLYGYEPPTAQQFVNGEAALAGLDGDSVMPNPVMISASDHDGAAPSGFIGTARNFVSDPPSAVVTAIADNSAEVSRENKADVAQTRTERLAQMDQKLLSDDLMRDISARAASERKRR